jgi:hypothetical protein
MINFNTKSLSLILSLFVISSLGGYIIYAWTGPMSAPPDANTPRPLNIGDVDQDKAARISATEYYDADNSSFYVNPSGDSSISGILTIGGDISDGSKTIYDSTSGRLDYSVLPYHKGDLTSDWESNVDASSYYDVSELSAGNVIAGVHFGRSNIGTFAGATCAVGSATSGDISCGLATDIDCDGVAESGTRCDDRYFCESNICNIASDACVGSTPVVLIAPNNDKVLCLNGSMLSPTLSGSYSWDDAVSACNNLTFAGFNDWALPNKVALLDVCAFHAAASVHPGAWDPLCEVGEKYWSSTVYHPGILYWWVSEFTAPSIAPCNMMGNAKAVPYLVRCARP